jgi:hypothetical protein
MKYFSLREKDSSRPSWVLRVEEKPAKQRRRPAEISPSVSRLLGPPASGRPQFKPRYERFRCKLCRRYDSYEVFEEGFDDDVKIRIKGDFGHTSDRIFVVNDQFIEAVRSVNAGGYELKALGNSGWHALRVNCLVELADGIPVTSGKICSGCGRPEYAGRLVERVSEIINPPTGCMFFASGKAWPYYSRDREIFLTEPIVNSLKGHGIGRGYCCQLFTEEEWIGLKKNGLGTVDDLPRWSVVSL